MVLDNLEDPKLIKDYLPSNHQGHVLITTRSQSLKGYAAIVQLKKMSNETGILFLLKRANLIPIDSSNLDELKADNKIDDVLITDAQKIVQAMDGLPLALEQAGAYIQESACSLADYLKSYEDVRNTATILDNDGEDANDHKSVYATFKLNFDVVKEKSVAAAKLLEVCSFLDSELIPEEIFTSAGNFLGDELAKLQDNTYEFNNCLKLLLGYSLIERNTNNKSLSIHRLVQTVIRELLTEDNKKLLVDSLAKALYSLSLANTEDPKNWPTYQKLLPSVTSFFSFVKLYQSNTVETADLFHNFGRYCDKQALYTQSLDFYNLALFIKKLLFDKNHPSIARTINNIGLIHATQGELNIALDLFQQALDIYNFCLDQNRYYLASTFNNIGLVYDRRREFPQALFHLKKALAIYKQFFPDSVSDIALSFNNIGNIYQQQGNLEKALKLFQNSLKIKLLIFGENHQDLAGTLNNIGLVYEDLGQFNDSLGEYEKSLNIKQHIFGNNHPDIALTLENLARLHKKFDKKIKAINYYQQAIDIYQRFFLPNHPSIIYLLKQYSQLLIDLNRTDEAQPLLDRLASLKQSKQE